MTLFLPGPPFLKSHTIRLYTNARSFKRPFGFFQGYRPLSITNRQVIATMLIQGIDHLPDVPLLS